MSENTEENVIDKEQSETNELNVEELDRVTGGLGATDPVLTTADPVLAPTADPVLGIDPVV